jgi:glutaredoxin
MHFKVITGDKCPYCDKAKELLTEKGHTFDESHVLDEALLMKKLGLVKVPQIFLITESGKPSAHIGGYNDLKDYFERIQA